MAGLKLFEKGYALFFISLLEVGTPFVRMLLLSRFIDLQELGFASILAATYGTFELVTDIAIHRFAYSATQEDFPEALASAHALALLRGLVVGVLSALAALPIAAAFSLSSHWESFAILGAVTIIRAFENIAPKVAERHLQFGAQLKVVVLSSALCILALMATLVVTRNHDAFIASLFGQAIGIVIGSHAFADIPYRLDFRSPQFIKAFHFGYPLMFNGLGLAVSAQGDRFLVGAMLGLPALGVYSVVMLAAIVPITMVFRFLGSFFAAALYSAADLSQEHAARLKLASRISSLVATVYALGVVILANIVVPAVFGRQFLLSHIALSLLAFTAFFRLARGEPFTSLLLLARRTRRLALINLSSVGALLFSAVVMYFDRTVEAALLGRVLGEIASLAVALYLTREALRGLTVDFGVSLAIGVVLVSSGCLFLFQTRVGTALAPSLLALAGYAVIALIWGLCIYRPFVRRGFAKTMAE